MDRRIDPCIHLSIHASIHLLILSIILQALCEKSSSSCLGDTLNSHDLIDFVGFEFHFLQLMLGHRETLRFVQTNVTTHGNIVDPFAIFGRLEGDAQIFQGREVASDRSSFQIEAELSHPVSQALHDTAEFIILLAVTFDHNVG